MKKISVILTDDESEMLKKIMRANEAIYNAWFESWLLNHVPDS